ncbi:helix-hairpin-helix domain-containing protein [Ruminococcus sp.]|uniref:ComEA family DNA-binding protein n=1 Tax=Ruminococcus sp. TaxID=41978 RepID=UPI0025FD343E|nr:helix-hairpin-helix domain-containing protein [Ruminococcus sp.]MBQ9541629.1 helix-hairpin-helix domain-containing protein [Ruminococcus sp.]
MKDGLFAKLKGYSLYALLAAALIISAVFAAKLKKPDEKPVVIYRSSSVAAEEQSEVPDSSKSRSAKKSSAKKSADIKVTTTKKPKETTVKTTTSKPPKTTAVTTTKAHEEEVIIYFPIDINLVTFEELTAIDGVGESTASAILGLREELGIISNMEQLLEVSGIGESRLEMLKGYLYVSEEDYIPIVSEEPQTTAVTEAPQTVTEVMTSADVTVASEEPVTIPSEPTRRQVNINTADKQELMDKLLIEEELAEEILLVREQLGGQYENYLQLLYVKDITKTFLAELKEYITL